MATKQKKVTVIINNRDLLDWPKEMIKHISRMKGLHEIIILDNGSTYKPLLYWYRTIPQRVEFLENLGHIAPWTSGILDSIDTDLYVVTDPDLDLSQVPDDCLQVLANYLAKHPEAGKVGLSLSTDGIPEASPYRDHVKQYAETLPHLPRTEDGLVPMPVDTTFAIYDRRALKSYQICGMRTPEPYAARHIPWEIVNPTGDFLYYLDHVEGRSSSYRDFTRYAASNSVRGLYKSHNGKVSTKWDSYLDIYEEIFSNFKYQPVDMLEIGIQNGGSLDIWSRYFPAAKTLTGCDINPRCGLLEYDDPRIQVIVGNANELVTFEKIFNRSRNYDIIIDDGSHRSNDVISSFLTYFPLLKPDGVFIVEDMHCAYWEEYGGGLLNQRSAASFFRNLLDTVNSDHFREISDPGALFQTFISSADFNKFIRENPILSITAHDSVYIIRKASVTRPRGLGSVVISGEEAIVDDRVLPKQ